MNIYAILKRISIAELAGMLITVQYAVNSMLQNKFYSQSGRQDPCHFPYKQTQSLLLQQ